MRVKKLQQVFISSFFKILGLFIMLAEFSSTAAESFITVRSTLEIESCLKDLPKDSMIFIDIDDTIITPISRTFRVAPYNKLMDNIKKNKDAYPNYMQIVSNWRLQRKVMLLDEKWPAIMMKLKERFSVYALTKMDTGKFGNISSMEKWRFEELKSLGIEFSKSDQIPNDMLNDGQNNPRFYNGIFITGEKSKGQTLEIYSEFIKADVVVMIDDRIEHLEDVGAFCDKHSIKFIGLLFKGLENLKERPDPAVSSFQSKHLIENAQWLEDEEALKAMNQK